MADGGNPAAKASCPSSFARKLRMIRSATRRLVLIITIGLFTIAACTLYWPIKHGYVGDFLEMITYGPFRYRRLVSQVQSASTAAQERDAFLAARQRGKLWEISLTDAQTNYVSSRDLSVLIADTNQTVFVRLEWLPTRLNGKLYEAHRRVIEKTNLYLLFSTR
jgi:hypothetical protein